MASDGGDPMAGAITASQLLAAVAAANAPAAPVDVKLEPKLEEPLDEPVEPNSVMIMGYRVAFPAGKKPFPAQLAVMNKVLTALKTGQHALLESPTGSGKTLALLCSSLTFQRQFTLDMLANEKLRKADAVAKAQVKTQAGHPPVSEAAKTDQSSDSIEDDDDDFAASQPSFAKFRYRAADAAKKRDREGNGATTEPTAQKKKRVLPMSFDAAAAAAEAAAQVDDFDDFHRTKAGEKSKKSTKISPPRIYFCSRTHSQLAQVVDELKNCPPSYLEPPDPSNPVATALQTCVLGSKPNYCVNPKVNRIPAQVDDKCQQLVQESKCPYFRKLKKTNDLRRATPPVWDIEDMLALAKRHRECAYFRARDALDHANIVFCPYNYLLDPSIREAVGITLKNSIVVLDEAHNVEDTCRSSASLEITSDILEAAIKAFTVVIKGGNRPPSYNALLKLLNGINRWLAHVILNAKTMLQATGFEEESRVWNGADALAMLAEFSGLTKDNFQVMKQHVVAVAENEKELSANGDQNESSRGRGDANTTETTILLGALALNTVRNIMNVVDYMFRDELKYLDDFKLIVMRNRPLWNNRKKSGRGSGTPTKAPSGDGWQTKLCIWCLNAAVAFSDVIKNARSVILTSGTLSPMESFAGELGTDFPIRLEANHVVNMRKQVFVGAVMNGPGFVDLSSTYKNQQEFRYQDSIGELLLQYSHAVPGGILMFLPSYFLMDKLASRWKQTGLLAKIEGCKTVFLEPRNAGKDFDALLDDYKSVIAETSASTQVKAENGEQKQTGAVFLAVYRGKVSEGIDFSNDNARAVLAVGIPYPSVKELQVSLKRKYQDEKSRVDKKLVNGHVWYNLQAFRALNQALGRCIRHRLDYGAIILLDSRHRFQAHTRSLSKWMRPFIREFEHGEQCLPMFDEFFARNAQELPKPTPPALPPSESDINATSKWIPAKRSAPVELKYEDDTRAKSTPQHHAKTMSSAMDSVRAFMARQQPDPQESRVFSIFEQQTRTKRETPKKNS